jgi:hypothetical protein
MNISIFVRSCWASDIQHIHSEAKLTIHVHPSASAKEEVLQRLRQSQAEMRSHPTEVRKMY